MKLKNKIDKKTGHFLCGGTSDQGCGCKVAVGQVSKGIVYCVKCAKKIKATQDKGG